MKKSLGESIDTLIRKEFSVLEEGYKRQISDLKLEITALKSQVACGGSSLNLSDKFKTLNRNTITYIVRDLLPISFAEQFDERLPMAFMLHVKHYNNRFQMYDILDALGIEYPSWYKNVILPHEWSKEQLALFINTVENHYVCNSHILSNNIHYWYEEHRENLVSPETQMKKSSYSDIPWQFVLKNPLWIDDELIEKVSLSIKKKKSHSDYFLNLFEYNKLSSNQMKILIQFVDDDKLTKLCSKDYVMQSLIDTKSDDIYKRIAKLNIIIPDYAPNTLRKLHLNKMAFSEAIKFIHNCDFFSELEKLELIQEQIKKEYSNVAMFERLIQ